MSSGFKSGSLPHLKYYEELNNLPTLHIYGESDDIIPKDMSESLRNTFEDPLTVIHPGKHYLPSSSAQKANYRTFFKIRYEEKQNKLLG